MWEGALEAWEPSVAPGVQVGEYVVEEKLGEGGFGSVYRAVHPVIGKAAAIKILSAHYSSNPMMVARFVAEARAVNQIRHPNIIDIFAFGKLHDGRRYYVMELLEGVPFDRYLRMAGPVPPPIALPLLRDIAQALDAAHAAGIAHRDLKPENMFVSFREGGQVGVKLLDFGIAKLLSAPRPAEMKTRTGAPLGTPQYMSPEQCRGNAVDQRTDVYSFGVVIHRVLTGRLPFEAGDALDLLNAQANTPPPRMSSVLPSLPTALDYPVLQMLAKDPDRRPPSAGAAFSALVEAAGRAGLDVALKTPDAAALLLAGASLRLGPFANEAGASVSTLPAPLGHTGTADRSMTPCSAPDACAASLAGAPGERPLRRGRRWLGPAVIAGVLCVASAVGLQLRGPARRAPGDRSPRVEAVARGVAALTLAASARSQAVSVMAAVMPVPAPEVTVSIPSLPSGTHVYLGDALVGIAPGPLRLPRGDQQVTLLLAADGYAWTEVRVLPDRDRLLSVRLQRVPAPPAAQARPKLSRDLEPF